MKNITAIVFLSLLSLGACSRDEHVPSVAHEQSPPVLSNFTVTIRSTPPGATVYLDRNRVGITPFTTTLGKDIYGVKIEKEGYQPKIGQIGDDQKEFYVELLPE